MRLFHRIYIVAIIITFFLSSHKMIHADEAERILNYHSYITVHKDRTLTITETIKVVSAGQQFQRGIYRTFPTKYKDRFNNTVHVGFKILEVKKDGSPEPYHTEKESNGIKLYIGSSNVYLRPGEYTYAIVYQTDRQLGFFEDFDELYWNVTGNDWAFTIEQVEAIIELPPEARIINKIAYTGRQGQQGKNYAIQSLGYNKIKFFTTSPLSFNEGLTIAVSWQKGVILEPTSEEKLNYFFSDNQNSLAALLGLIILFGYYSLVWLRVGKDPEKGVIYPQFQPPQGFSPAASRYVMRMGYSDRVFAAAVVNMAVKGFLQIEKNKSQFTLTKINSNESNLSAGERKIVNKLFGGQNSIKLKQTNHRSLQSAVTALKKSLKLDFEKLHFRRNSSKMIFGIIISILIFAAVILTSSNRSAAAFITLWLTGWTAGTSFLVSNVIKAWKSALTTNGSSVNTKGTALATTLFSLPFIGGELFGLFVFTMLTSILAVLLILIVIFLNILFYRLLKAPTILGRRMMDHIEGFKMYLETAEEERLNMMSAPNKTPELYEKFLPYALALDVEVAWTEKFSDVLARSSQDAATYSPAWYSGTSLSRFSTAEFSTNLGSSLSSAISSSSRAPGSSSGSGGGGSSGGGGGGGGGGGW